MLCILLLLRISFCSRRSDLAIALSKQTDIVRLRELCRGHEIPSDSRADVWKVCLIFLLICCCRRLFIIFEKPYVNINYISIQMMQVCLNVNGKLNPLNQCETTLETADQQIIRKDCQNYAGKFDCSMYINIAICSKL